MPAFDAIGMDAVGVSSTPSAVVVNLITANSAETSTSSTGAATITPASNTVNLFAANSTETATSSTGAATVTPVARTVNLTASNSSETAASSTGAAMVTPPPKTVGLTAAGSTETPTSSTGAAVSFIPPLPVNPAMLYAMPGSGWNFPDLIAGDVVTLSFDFKGELPPGVTVKSAAAHPVVHVGVDPNPAALLAGDPTVDGSIVSVRAHASVTGCAYWPRVTATLTDGQAITYPLPGEGSLRVVA